MKTKVFLIAILILTVIFTSCTDEDLSLAPSNKVTTTNFSASNISKLDVSDVFNVYVSFSETNESVEVEANENIHHLIEMSQSGDRLIIGLQKNSRISGAPVLNVYIKTASLEEISAEGATKIEFQNQLLNDFLDIELSGASTFKGSVNVDELVAELYGAGKMEISGSSNYFEITAEGASEMSDFGFQTNSLDADLEGGSTISLTINERLDVSATGASNVYYKGNGVIQNQHLSGSSKIVKID